MIARVAGRASYDGVAVAVPVTVPYQRYSTQGAHWFIGRAMDALVERSGIAKDEIDGLTISSFSAWLTGESTGISDAISALASSPVMRSSGSVL